MLTEMLNLCIPSASDTILEKDFKTLAHKGLNPGQKLSEIIKSCSTYLAPSEDVLVNVMC